MSGYPDVRRAVCQVFDDAGAPRGSGFFVLPDGHLITCEHVVEGVRSPRIRLVGEADLCRATRVDELSDSAADVAVLKVARELPCVQLGPTRERIDVLAHGFRPREQGTEPSGHTFQGRLEPGQALHTTTERFGAVKTFVTTDGLVPGVSGGPVYDPQLRRVVGVLRAVEGGARAYVIEVGEAVPALVDLNRAMVPDQALDELIRVHDVKLVSEDGRPLASLADRDFRTLLSDYEVFGGRREELTRIDRFLEEEGGGYFFVTGYAGFGKTALLVALTRRLKSRGSPMAYYFITRLDEHVEGEACLRSLCTQLLVLHQLSAELRTRSFSELRALYEDLLRLPPTSEHPVVVVLDGLDEALGHWEPRGDLFPRDIAQGTRVVFSARRMADREWLPELGLESLPSERVVELGRLNAADIREAIEASGVHDPVALEAAVSAVEELSEGDPFYVSDLLVELRERGGDPAGLEGLPIGHNAYLVRWWKEGRSGTDTAAFEDLMGTLAVAKGPLRATDLPDISTDDGLTRANIDDILEPARRYLTGDASHGYQLGHSRIFAFVRDRLVEGIPGYSRSLLDWCRSFAEAGWPPSTPPYVLSHYVDHLADALDLRDDGDAARQDLYAVAEDPAYRLAQRRAAPDESAREMRPLQAALTAAAEADDPVAMARYVLLQARLIAELSGQQAILAALQSPDQQLAVAAAAHADPAHRTLLYLLFAWALVDAGGVPGARELLERLTATDELPRLVYWEGACAAFLLSRLHALPDIVDELAARVLSRDEDWQNLLLGLVAAADAGALAVFDDSMSVFVSGAWSTHVPLDTPPGEAAADQLSLARRLVGHVDGYEREVVLLALVRAHLRRGDEDEALTVARAVTGDFRASALLDIAAHLQATDRAPAAAELFREAWRACSTLDAQIAVCSAAKNVGIVDQGREILSWLADEARQRPESDQSIYTRGFYLGRVAEALAELDDYPAAAAIADEISDVQQRDAARLHVVRGQLASGLTDDASATVDALESVGARATALATIASSLAGVDRDRSRSTAREAARLVELGGDKDYSHQDVKSVAEALARVGLDAEARRLAGTLPIYEARRTARVIAERQAERGDGEAAWDTLSASQADAMDAGHVIWRLLRRGDINQARVLMGRVEGPEANDWDLREISASIAAAVAASGDGDTARGHLTASIAGGGSGGQAADARTAQSIVYMLLDHGAVEPALHVAEGIGRPSNRAHALITVLERQMEDGDTAAAERTRQLAEEAVAATAGAEHIRANVRLAEAEARVHRASAAARLEEAAAIARDLSPPDRRAGESIAAAWARLGDGDAALQTATSLIVMESAPDSWTRLARTLDRAGLQQAADAAFRHARAALALLKDDERAYPLASVGRALAESGRISEALDLAGKLHSESYASELLANVAASQAKAGDPSAARATLVQGRETALRLDDFSRRSALVSLARTSLELGDAELALELAAAADSSAVAEIRAKQAVTQGLFHEALDEAERIDTDFTADEVLEQLIAGALDADDVQTAWTATRRQTQEYAVAKSVGQIAEHASNRGDFELAVETATQIVEESIRSRTLASIALAQAGAGLGAAAVRTAELIRTDQAQYLSGIAGALGEAGLREDVKRLLVAATRSIDAAYAMCAVLADTYPDQTHAITEVLVQLPPLSVTTVNAADRESSTATGRFAPMSATETVAAEAVVRRSG